MGASIVMERESVSKMTDELQAISEAQEELLRPPIENSSGAGEMSQCRDAAICCSPHSEGDSAHFDL